MNSNIGYILPLDLCFCYLLQTYNALDIGSVQRHIHKVHMNNGLGDCCSDPRIHVDPLCTYLIPPLRHPGFLK